MESKIIEFKEDLDELSKINYTHLYKEEYQEYQETFNGKNLPWLLNAIEIENNLLELKEQLLGLCQVMTYSLIEIKNISQSKKAYQETKKILNNTQKVLENYFLFKKNDLNEIKKNVLNNSFDFFPMYKTTKLRDLNTEKRIIQNLKVLKNHYQDYKPDNIIGISAGGIESALLSSSILNLDEIDIIRCSMNKGYGNESYEKMDKKARLPLIFEERLKQGYFKNKNILVVDDIIIKGKTIKKVAEKIKKYFPKEIYVIASNDYGADPFFKNLV